MKNKPKNPDQKLITLVGWDLLYFLDQNEEEKFGGICNSIIKNNNLWTKWCTHNEPHIEPLPLEF